MARHRHLVAVVTSAALLATACSGGDESRAGSQPSSTTTKPSSTGSEPSSTSSPPSGSIDPATFSAEVDHPFVPLSSVRRTTFEGRERDRESSETTRTRVEQRVLDRTELVAGVQSAVVDVREFEDGELVEHTEDYYAQHDDGSVWYMGERVDDYEDGKLTGHGGEWLAGQDGAQAGLFMPTEPAVGQTFEQERAPGVAEDRSTVVAVDVEMSTPAGTFTGCIKTEDFAPLDNATEFKFYCPDVGLVREEGPRAHSNLVSYG